MSRTAIQLRRSLKSLAALAALAVLTSSALAQTGGTGGVRSGGSTGLGGGSGLGGGTGLGGTSGLGGSSLGGGLGGTGSLSGGLGGTGSLSGGLGGTGSLSGGLGGSSNLGLGTTSMSFGSGSFSGTLSTQSLGFSGISSGGFSAGGYRAGGYGATGGAANLATSAARFAGIASSNPFGSYYANPLAAGMSSTGSAGVRFGSPLYTISSNSTGLQGGVGTASVGTNSLSSANSANTSNSTRSVYGPTLNLSPPGPIVAAQPRADLQQVLSRSSSLSSKDSFQVLGQGEVVVLRGTAVSDYDRQMAEALLRLSPGVYTIRNEITVQPGGSAAGSP